MKRIGYLPPLAALAILLLAPILSYKGLMSLAEHTLALNLATAIWFGTAVLRPLFAGSRLPRE